MQYHLPLATHAQDLYTLLLFDEFIDEITEGRGEEIKKQIRGIELNGKKRKKRHKGKMIISVNRKINIL